VACVLLLLSGCGCGDDDDDHAVGDGDADGDVDAGDDAGDPEDAGRDAGGEDAGTDAAVIDPCCPEGGMCCRAADLGYPADLCVQDGPCPAPCSLCAPGQWCVEPVVGLPAQCLDDCAEDRRADDGVTCCPTGTLFEPGVGCPLPDLTVDATYLAAHIELSTRSFSDDACEIEEGCIEAPGERRLLRFGLRTPNIGAGNLHFGDPTDNPLFTWSDCHFHNHFNGYARYRLFDGNGQEVAFGHKQAFCLLDFEPIDPDDPRRVLYDCYYQGIQAGWADIYESRLPCQWIDITGVPPGDYTIEATVNFEGLIVEADLANNTVTVPITIEDPADNTCPNGCPSFDGGCCIDGDPCGYAGDGYCDCDGQIEWDAADCLNCTSEDPDCP
jgi:hypothetical protein